MIDGECLFKAILSFPAVRVDKACIVQQHVNGKAQIQNRCRGTTNAVKTRHIHLHQMWLEPTCAHNGLREICAFVEISTQKRELCTLSCKTQCGSTAYACCGSGNDDVFR